MANIPAPFTENQVDYFRRSLTSWFNVAEGGKRGGKNVLQVLAFCTALQTHPNRLHLIAGVSQANARLNIVDCDGFGIANFLEGHYREGKYKDKPAIYVQTPAGEKIILISGGGKDGDEKYIKGNTYGMAYVTEANECHPRFIAEVFDRTLSSANRKVFHDLNPKDENHWYYTDILGHHEQMQAKLSDYGYNYGHFTIADNLSIPDDKLRTILRSYKKGTVWYRRDIRGERCAAEGLVYPYFVDNEESFYINAEDVPRRDIAYICVGQDFGGNKSWQSTPTRELRGQFVCNCKGCRGLRTCILFRIGFENGENTASPAIRRGNTLRRPFTDGGGTHCLRRAGRFGTCPVPLWCANVKENDVRLGFALRQARSC
jgi:catechol 2,3-dioxygenase-like lactoylglutathione lyase family enzyme